MKVGLPRVVSRGIGVVGGVMRKMERLWCGVW